MKRNLLISILTLGLVASLMCGCEEISQEDMSTVMNNIETAIDDAGDVLASEDTLKTIRIISTSDMHGKMLAYDYAQDQPDASGSLAQVCSAVKEYRNDNTILVDVGDAIQDNFADLFIDEEVHPMMAGMNAMGYDICTVGNHEFNYGTDVALNYISSFKGDFILGNFYDPNGELVTDAYKIIEKDGVKIAFIGMVTPNIEKWDGDKLNGYTVTDPAVETNKIIDSIENQVDIIVGVFHMMEDDEYQTEHSGFASMAAACPRLNLILGSHGHQLVNKNLTNNIPVSENLNFGKSIQIADITVDTSSAKSTIKQIQTTAVETADYPQDPEIVTLLSSYDDKAKGHARSVIGTLENGPLVPESDIKGVNSALTTDTPLLTLLQNVMMHYAKSDIAASMICTNEDNAVPGDLSIASICRMYKYSNTLYKLEMTGAQLKKYMEWSASFYQQYKDGDLIIAFDDRPVYLYDTFGGVNYEIDISKPVGERIVNLTRNGKPINDDDILTIAVSNYRANTMLLSPGEIYEADDMPKLLEADMRSDIGDIRLLIADYIQTVKDSKLTPDCDDNWKIIGNDWDSELHEEAVSQINNGTLSLTEGAKSNPCVKKITVNDLK